MLLLVAWLCARRRVRTAPNERSHATSTEPIPTIGSVLGRSACTRQRVM